MCSEKKRKANQSNSRKSTGPKDSSRSRFNAVRHGLLQKKLTALDDEQFFEQIRSDLRSRFNPEGELEEHMIESAALDFIRSDRAKIMETETITQWLNPEQFERPPQNPVELFQGKMVDRGLPARINASCINSLLLHQRYESSFLARFCRTLRELERLQQLRRSKPVPPPMSEMAISTSDLDTGDQPLPSIHPPGANAPSTILDGNEVGVGKLENGVPALPQEDAQEQREQKHDDPAARDRLSGATGPEIPAPKIQANAEKEVDSNSGSAAQPWWHKGPPTPFWRKT
jgi:hypothetical protein